MIPPLSAIHSAHFEMTLNKEKSLSGNYPIDSIIYAELFPTNRSFDLDTIIRSYDIKKTDDKFILPSITSAVEYWNRNQGKGVLVLQPAGNSNALWELDKLNFYGPGETDSTKRPVLKIIYTRTRKK